MRNRSSLLIGTELIVIGIHTAGLNWYRGLQWITRPGRGTNGRTDGRTDEWTNGQTHGTDVCSMYGNVERGMPATWPPVPGKSSNYGSACVFQEDRWNLMEPNGYSFEVKVSLAKSRRVFFFFNYETFSHPRILRRASRYEAYEVAIMH